MVFMEGCQKWWLYLLSFLLGMDCFCFGRIFSLESSNITIRIAEKVIPNKEQYLCTSTFLPRGNFYITSYTPLVSNNRVHHLILFACREPDFDMRDGYCESVCDNGKPIILYAWGRKASPLILPPDSGFDVGDDAELFSLVLQVHYLDGARETEDRTGVMVHMVTQPPHYKVSVFLLMANMGEIPPHKKNFALNISCRYRNEETLHPFAFRVHAHSLGRNIVAYTQSHKTGKIQEIGRANSQWPQSFFPTKPQLRIERNDWLMARCTYDSTSRSTITRIGSSHHDEMCNFYLMYFKLRDSERYVQQSRYQDMCSKDYLGIGSFDRLPPENVLPEIMPAGFFTEKPIEMAPLELGIKLDAAWKLNAAMGQVSGVAIDNKRRHLLIFHRGSHTWEHNTFDRNFIMRDSHLVPEYTMLHMNIDTGKIELQWGNNIFRLPHGVHVSAYNEKDGDVMIWVTDVGAHVVMGFTYDEWKVPSILLGTLNEPGNDDMHFCQPADVITNKKGEIFVADGYCNARIVKFTSQGKFIKSWESTQGQFMVVHSLIILHDLEWICAADRERAAIECFDFDGSFKKRISSSSGKLGSSVFAIGWDSVNSRILGASIEGNLPSPEKAFGFVVPMSHNKSNLHVKDNEDVDSSIKYWGIKDLTTPHALALSSDAKTLFVAQISHEKVMKFTIQWSSPETDRLGKPKTSLMKRLQSLNSETLILVGILLVIPLALIILWIILIRYFRCSGGLVKLNGLKRIVLIGRKVDGYNYHHNGHNTTRNRKAAASRNRRLDRGPSFQPLRQDESDMEETVGLNLPQSKGGLPKFDHDMHGSILLSPTDA